MGERLLLVDDERNWLSTLEDLFSMGGHEVRTASTVDEAFAVLHEGWPSKVVTDGMNGGWARICQEANQYGVPAVVFTGNWDIIKVLQTQGIPHADKADLAMRRITVEDILTG